MKKKRHKTLCLPVIVKLGERVWENNHLPGAVCFEIVQPKRISMNAQTS
jgi:hypothetical protein